MADAWRHGSYDQYEDEDDAVRMPLNIGKTRSASTSSGGQVMYGSQHHNVTGATSIGHRFSPFTSYMKHEVEPGDTLAGISLKYTVPINDLKQINRLYGGDSIFSRSTLLIPVNESNRDSGPAETGAEVAANAAAIDRLCQSLAAPVDAFEKGPEGPYVDPASEAIAREGNAATLKSQGPSSKDFLAKFDHAFSMTKASIEAIHSQGSSSEFIVKSSASHPHVTQSEVGARDPHHGAISGIKGDTSDQSYQNPTHLHRYL